MSDRVARLEELRKITRDSNIREMDERLELILSGRKLTSVPPGVCDLTSLMLLGLWKNQLSSLPPEISQLTGLTLLSIGYNQLSSLPPEISQLTRLTEVHIYTNPIEELPQQITTLTNLSKLYLSYDGKANIKRAPRGISNLPCWNEGNDDYKYIRALQLYDHAPVPALQTAAPSAQSPSDPNSVPATSDYTGAMTVEFSSN